MIFFLTGPKEYRTRLRNALDEVALTGEWLPAWENAFEGVNVRELRDEALAFVRKKVKYVKAK